MTSFLIVHMMYTVKRQGGGIPLGTPPTDRRLLTILGLCLLLVVVLILILVVVLILILVVALVVLLILRLVLALILVLILILVLLVLHGMLSFLHPP